MRNNKIKTKLSLLFLAASTFAVATILSAPAYSGANQRFFLKTKTTRVPGASLVESCRIRLRVKIRRATPGPGNTVICTVPWDSANANNTRSNYSGSAQPD